MESLYSSWRNESIDTSRYKDKRYNQRNSFIYTKEERKVKG